MFVQATTHGRQYHKSALRRMTGLPIATARQFKAKDDGKGKIIDIDDTIGSLLVSLKLAIVINRAGKPAKLSDRAAGDIVTTAAAAIEKGGLRFQGAARKTKNEVIAAAEKHEKKQKEEVE